MPGLSAKSRALLNDLAMRADRELTKSSTDPGRKTRRSRQAYFLKFLSKMEIDPKQWLGDGSKNPLWIKLAALYAIDIRVNNINLGTMRVLKQYVNTSRH